MGGPAKLAPGKLPFIAVVGGSYTGIRVSQVLAQAMHKTHRILLIEKNSHFHHLFAFPRYAVTEGSADVRWLATSGSLDGSGLVDKRKAFIPLNPGTFKDCPEGSGLAVQAKVISVTRELLKLDKAIEIDGQLIDEIPYSYLILALGTKYTPPSTIPAAGKQACLEWLRNHCQQVQRSHKITIIGGGAAGVQMATDIKELSPEKQVTLVHSRRQLMNAFHEKLSDLVIKRAQELGLNLMLGSRVNVPPQGYPNDGSTFSVELQDGRTIETDFAIIATGAVPQSQAVQSFIPQCIDEKGYINVKKTLQINDPSLPNVFAIGDIANTGAHKAARPGFAQADVIVANIEALQRGQDAVSVYEPAPPGIHLSLGITENVIFSNPRTVDGEPTVKLQSDGRLDMNIDGVWKRRGVGEEYHL